MAEGSHCESLVGPPQVVWGFERAWKSWEGQHCEGPLVYARCGRLSYPCGVLSTLSPKSQVWFRLPDWNVGRSKCLWYQVPQGVDKVSTGYPCTLRTLQVSPLPPQPAEPLL